jgi:hypothetical protein
MTRLRAMPAAICLTLLTVSAAADMTRSPFPILRPDAVLPRTTPVSSAQSIPALTVSLIPRLRPKSLAVPVVSNVTYRTQGSVCGHTDIRGTQIVSIPAKMNGCGLENPVRVTEIAGVKLSRPATLDCTTAKALRVWIDKGAKPAIKRKGRGLAEIKVAASYSCRTRNNQAGAKVSEHGRGRAIDISGFTLKNGDTISVLKGWSRRVDGKILRKMHKAACGPFGTVLGPNANTYHKDHFHFDTARYRSGSYCS